MRSQTTLKFAVNVCRNKPNVPAIVLHSYVDFLVTLPIIILFRPVLVTLPAVILFRPVQFSNSHFVPSHKKTPIKR